MALEGQVRSVARDNSSAVDLVTAEIRRAVLTGALAAGEQFSIRDLALQLGVSHIPIREALRRLESQGLIVLRQARSAAVAPLSIADMEAIYRLRTVIELPLAGTSAGRHSPEQVTRLHELLETSRDHDPERAWQAHYDLHAALVHPAANEWDERVLHTLWFATERYSHLVFDPTQITEEERAYRYGRHKVLVDAALAGDAAAMSAALDEHLSTNRERIREFIARLESEQNPS
ncbi:GntR family transcriptional regulator [Glaciibacter flavus]|uniref:GntR family transcriptional regulator n=1 Tax=Orlajensenia flava TaxID=2565934 RepID=UPI003B007A9B